MKYSAYVSGPEVFLNSLRFHFSHREAFDGVSLYVFLFNRTVSSHIVKIVIAQYFI